MMNYLLNFLLALFLIMSCSGPSEKKEERTFEMTGEIEEVLESTSETETKEQPAEETDTNTDLNETASFTGVITRASDDTGLPYTHNLTVKNDSASMDFTYFGGEFMGEFVDDIGKKCTVRYRVKKENYSLLIELLENGEVIQTYAESQRTDVRELPTFEGIYNPNNWTAGDLPIDFSIVGKEDSLQLNGWPSNQFDGKDVRVYYDTNENYEAVLVDVKASLDTVRYNSSQLGQIRSNQYVYLTDTLMELDSDLILEGLENVTIDGLGNRILMNNLEANVIQLYDAKDVVIKNLRAKHIEPKGYTGCSGNVLAIWGGINVTVQNCELNGSGIVGIASFDTNGLEVRNNHIHSNTEYGIIYQGMNVTIVNNKFENNTLGHIYYGQSSDNWPPEDRISTNLNKPGLMMSGNTFDGN